MKRTFEKEFYGKKIVVEIGELAKQANSACLVKYGDTVVLTAVVNGKEPTTGDFFPLMVLYQEKLYSVGKIPGGFIKREGRPTEAATLAARLIDRPIRPLFKEGFKNEVQIINTVLSVDTAYSPELTALFGSSLALTISDLPFEGPVAGVVVGRINGKFVINPTPEEQEQSDIYLTVAGTKDAINMVESSAKQVSEEDMLEALMFWHEAVKELILFEEEIEKETYKDEKPLIKYEEIGIIKDDFTLKDKYISYLINTGNKIDNLKVVFDLANGSSSVTAPEIFNKVLKNPVFLSSKPNGININDNCGSTHLDNLINYVKKNKFDLGIAFDGDADRCLFVDEDGNIIDGDYILAIVALNLKKKNKLKNNTLVGTILSNLGLIKFCNENNINFSATKVGDRYVLEEMLKHDYYVGGEQSGHIIFYEHEKTGDGLFTALQILNIINEENKSLKECSKIMKKYPQVSKNIKVKNEDKKELFTNDEINNIINKSKDILKPSGTEPLVRVMIEGNDLTLINNLLEDISCVIENKIGIK